MLGVTHLTSSNNGNPRYSVRFLTDKGTTININTMRDAMIGYSITNELPNKSNNYIAPVKSYNVEIIKKKKKGREVEELEITSYA